MKTIRQILSFLFVSLILTGVVGCEKQDQPEKDLPVPEAVDLGLSVKWASLNVGARTPQDFGYYFAWGETAPKSIPYTFENYSLCQGAWNSLTKYNCDSRTGSVVDGKTVLEAEDDAAHAAYGGKWRMPTIEEIKELCEAPFLLRKVVVEEGVWGIRITSAKTGNSIFLPAGGEKNESSSTQKEGEWGCFWSSSVVDHGSQQAYSIMILPSLSRVDRIMYVNYLWTRNIGASVRAVQ